MNNTIIPPVKNIEAVVQSWNNSAFFAPDTVVLGLDIGIEGIGITIRKGQEWIYSKTLLVELPEAKALATRRAYRASRHARKNRKKRMMRLKQLFEKHGLPWVDDDIMSRTDPFKLRYRAITGKLASKEALSICIRSCVLRRGYDYFAMNDDDPTLVGNNQEMPWGEGYSLTDAKQWVSSAYVDKAMMEYLINITPQLVYNKKELNQLVETKKEIELGKKLSDEWIQLVHARHEIAEAEGIPAMLAAYAKKTLNERKARGKNYPRAHVQEHLLDIIHRHTDLIDDAEAFEAALFRPCDTWQDKQHAIFRYNRKTPQEAKRHFRKKVKNCPWCEWLGIPTVKCDESGDPDIRIWNLIDFVSVRNFDIQENKNESIRTKLPEEAVQVLVEAIQSNTPKWIDVKKALEAALKKMNLKLASGDWNKAQLVQLKDIVVPPTYRRHGRASMSAAAARAMVDAATDNGQCYAPDFIENWKKSSGLYDERKKIKASGGIYPQVQTLLGTLRKHKQGQPQTFATIGFLQKLFRSPKVKERLGGKIAPDYCIIECIKNPATNKDRAKEIKTEQDKNRKRREELAAKFNRTHCSNAEFLRMKLFTEQGGTETTPAICPFTGEELKIEDLFTAKLELAHIYPDSRGGLYMADNLVLTTAETNRAMGNRTPKEAAHASLSKWSSWEEMLKQSRSFRWSEAKRTLFSFDTTNNEFPDFNNTTRTAQLANELRRLAAIWMGIDGDEEALRTRIGNPYGVYTAAARRSFLWHDYVKDRSDNRHHRWDAAVMTCLPPDGLNDVLYRGIFQTEKIGNNRRLSCIQGLNTPDFLELKYDGDECPVVKITRRSKHKSLGDSTFWSADVNGQTRQRIPLTVDSIDTAHELYSILIRMGIPAKDIPSEKQLEAWLVDSQEATKADKDAHHKPLVLNNGTPIKKIWNFAGKNKGKGNLDNSPLGWHGIISEDGIFDQLRKLADINERLELWIGWNAKKKRWEYYKKVIPTRAALDGIRRMGLPWRGTKNAPEYLINLLARRKVADLYELIYGKLPKDAHKIGTFRKGDVFRLDFNLDSASIQKQHSVDMINHPKTIHTWGIISAIKTTKSIKLKSLLFKDRKDIEIANATTLAILIGLPANPDDLAVLKGLTPPV